MLDQRDVALELVVVDEASSDGTPDYLGQLDGDVQTIRHDQPKGVAAARNAGLARASGDWVAFVDDDDLWAPDKLAAQLEAVQASGNAAWVLSGEVVVGEDLKVRKGTRPPAPTEGDRILLVNAVPGGGSATLVRRDLAREVGGFDTRLSILADWELWIRLYRAAPFASVDRPLVGYYRHGESMSHDRNIQAELDLIHWLHEALRVERGVRYSDLPMLEWRTQVYLRAGQRSRALGVLVQAVRNHRDLRSLLRLGGAIFCPDRLTRRWDLLDHKRVPNGWEEEAESWLSPLRDATPGTVPGDASPT